MIRLCITPLSLLLLLSSCQKAPSGKSEDYTSRARALLGAKKFEEAGTAFRKAIQLSPDSAEAHFGLALVETELRRPNETFASLTRVLELKPEHAEAKVRLADLCLASHLASGGERGMFYQKLAGLVRSLSKAEPASFDALRLSGHLAQLDGRYAEAISSFRSALAVRPNHLQTETGLAAALLAVGKLKEAELMAQNVIRRSSGASAAYDVLFRSQVKQGKQTEATTTLERHRAANSKDPDIALRLAQHYIETGHPGQAQAVFTELRDGDKYPSGILDLSDWQVTQGDLTAAMVTLQQAVARRPDIRLESLKRLAGLQLATSRNDDAIRTIREILTIAPKDEEALGLDAALRIETSSGTQLLPIIEVLKKVVQARPNQSTLRFNLARALEKAGNLPDAEREYSAVLVSAKGYSPARLALCRLEMERGNMASALRYADEAIAQNAEDVQARLARAEVLRTDGQVMQARSELDVLQRKLPGSVEVRLSAALQLLAEKKAPEAESAFRRLYRRGDQDRRALAGLVKALNTQGKTSTSLGLLKDELQLAPETIEIRAAVAATALMAGDPSTAAEQFQRISEIAPEQVDARIGLAELEARRRNFEGALAQLNKAEQIAPKDPRPSLLKAAIYEAQGSREQAAVEYRRRITLLPQDAVAMNNLAYLLAAAGSDLDDALKLAGNAAQIGKHPDFLDTLGFVYCKKKMYDSALQVLNGLTAKYPQNATYRYHLALALAGKGESTKAHTEVTTALRYSPGPEVERKLRDLDQSLRR